MMPPPRRKKWTEAEERTLIDKYGEMVCDGSLSKMKTREKKFKPIALHVNSIHHLGDPVAFPWEWSWKDVSNKVQNMRHQYSLVKQKIKRPESGETVVGGGDGFDWVEGLTHWSNFLRYKEVFGDFSLSFDDSPPVGNAGGGFDDSNLLEFGNLEQSGGAGGGDGGVIGLEFDYEGGEGEENYNNGFVYGEIETMGSETRKKKKSAKNFEKKAWGFVAHQLAQLREMEARFEQREEEREKGRQRRESLRVESEKECKKEWEEMRKQKDEREKRLERSREERIQEWEAMEAEREDRKRRREEEQIQEKKREESRNVRRSEWKARIDEMLSQHRAEMVQVQARVLHEQQNVMSQLLGVFSQWAGPDGAVSGGHYLSQMMQNLHHVGGMVDGDGDGRAEGHGQEDQFIVDG